MYEAPAIEAESSRVRAMFDSNVFGVFDMVSAFAPLLIAAVSDPTRPPTIINTASVLARVPYPFSSGYNATKAAVAAYSDTLRLELAPLGVKVVTLYMGVVSTGISTPDSVNFGAESIYLDAEAGVKNRSLQHKQDGMQPSEFAQQVVKDIVSGSRGPGKGEYLWRGSNAWLIWFLNAFGWRKVFDRTSESEVGFNDKVKQAVAARARTVYRAS